MPKTKYSARTQDLVNDAIQEYKQAWGLIALDNALAYAAIEYKKTTGGKEWFVLGRDGLVRLGHSSNLGSRQEQAGEALNNARVPMNLQPFIYLKRPATAFQIPDGARNDVWRAFREDFATNAEHKLKLLEKQIRINTFQELERFLVPGALDVAEKICEDKWGNDSANNLMVYNYNVCAGSSTLAGTCLDSPLAQRADQRITALGEFTKFDRFLLEPELVAEIDRGVAATRVLAKRFGVGEVAMESTKAFETSDLSMQEFNSIKRILIFLTDMPTDWLPRDKQEWKELAASIVYMRSQGMDALVQAAGTASIQELKRKIMPGI